jgi:hypothetical protein
VWGSSCEYRNRHPTLQFKYSFIFPSHMRPLILNWFSSPATNHNLLWTHETLIHKLTASYLTRLRTEDIILCRLLKFDPQYLRIQEAIGGNVTKIT